MSPVFTVTQTWKPDYIKTSPSQLYNSFRPDLNRRAQVLTAAKDRQDSKAARDWADYMLTWDTPTAHECFLRALLNEACHYQAGRGRESVSTGRKLKDSNTWRSFIRRVRDLAEDITQKMGGDDDHYAELLQDISRYNLFQDVWQEERQPQQDSAQACAASSIAVSSNSIGSSTSNGDTGSDASSGNVTTDEQET